MRYRCVYCVYGLCLPALSQCLRVFTNFCVSLRNKDTRNVIFAETKSACGSQEDFTRANTCHKISERHPGAKKKRLRQKEDLTKLRYGSRSQNGLIKNSLHFSTHMWPYISICQQILASISGIILFLTAVLMIVIVNFICDFHCDYQNVIMMCLWPLSVIAVIA